jgi:chaperone required for assembly of F1-ATPase
MSKEPQGLAADFFVEANERDPSRAARDSARAAAPKRFYKEAKAAPGADGFVVTLDGKPVRTPGRRPILVPWRALAEALAAEWAAQDETIDPASMPFTRLVNTAIDGVAGRMAEVEAEVLKYAGSDLICYRAGEPDSLVRAQSAAWDPLLAFAREKLGARLILAQGVMFAAQPETALAALAGAVRTYVGEDAGAPLRLAALHTMTALTGSCMIALAVALREIDAAAAWAAAHVDEDHQMRLWGADGEALARRALRRAEMQAADALLRSAASG